MTLINEVMQWACIATALGIALVALYRDGDSLLGSVVQELHETAELLRVELQAQVDALQEKLASHKHGGRPRKEK